MNVVDMIDRPALQVQALAVEVDDTPLLAKVSLTLAADGITVIMGPNGAGKSLFLRVLHGLVAPTSGKVLWARAQADRQAMVFQQPVLLRRSVVANVDFALKASGGANPGLRDDVLARVGLADKAHLPARRLSGGEAQRLAIARALATRPAVLFLDEPTASLDPASTEAIEKLVKDIARQGVRVLFVTHDIGQGRRLADDVIFFHQGRLVEHREAPGFFDAPQSPIAQAYLAGRFHLQETP